ncbi:MAG: NUDIX domain-containing protein [Ferruginibacter sp.]
MFIKIYFGDKPVFLCDKIDKELDEILHHPDAVFMDEINVSAINSLLHEIKKEEFHAGVLLHEDLNSLKKAFFKHFIIIQAAGGLVSNEKKEMLLIFRNGKWDLPKGKLEKGEALETCAVREVEEETGLKDIQLKSFLTTTYHTYNDFGKNILKESHWYKMNCPSQQQLIPQTEEGITEIKWVAKKELKHYMNNTFPSIKDVMDVE